MLRSLTRKTARSFEWVIYQLLNEKQREFLKNSLSENQKRLIRRLLFSGQMHRKQVNSVKHRLYNLGFTKRGLAELQELCSEENEPYLRRLAAWELALWHANQYSEDGARRCLELLPLSIEGEKNPARLRQAAIMEAECYDLLGEVDAAKKVITGALELGAHPDLYLAAANLESTPSARVDWINKTFELYGTSPIILHESEDRPVYDRLAHEYKQQENIRTSGDQPKVTVIMPVYNAEDVIQTALNAMLAQTWTNLEVLVVDDCSTDNTVSVIEPYTKADARIQLIKAEANGGAYVARNLALRVATGDFVTINDADDWSHPEKIERQVQHLLENDSVIGNTSEQARVTNDLKFYRRGRPGSYIFSNMSSFMFRRKEVMDAIGYWDSVRFAADSEFIRRIRKVFGEKAVVEVPTGPLAFNRQTDTSLTGNQAFGYHGFKMGARREYEEGHDHHHNTAKNLYYDFPQKTRPFAVPEPMWPEREKKDADGYRRFDTIIASDFRLSGTPLEVHLEEIKFHKKMGRRIGLIQLSQYDVSPEKPTHSLIRELIDGDRLQMLVYGEKVACDSVIIMHPPVLQEWQRYIPEVKAREVHVIISQWPSDINLHQCQDRLSEYFGTAGVWHPIDAAVHKSLKEHDGDGPESITLGSQNWGAFRNGKSSHGA